MRGIILGSAYIGGINMDFGALDLETQLAIRESQRKRKQERAKKKAKAQSAIAAEAEVQSTVAEAEVQSAIAAEPGLADRSNHAEIPQNDSHAAAAECAEDATAWEYTAASTVNAVTLGWSARRGTDLELKLHRRTLIMGDIVQLGGLVGAAQHNDKQGTIQGFNREKGRYKVSLHEEDEVLVKQLNITLLSASEKLERAGVCTTMSAIAKAGSSQHTFYPLTPGMQFCVEVRQSGELLEQLELTTLPLDSLGQRRPSWGSSRWGAELFVTAAGPGEPHDLNWVVEAPGDWLWASSWQCETLLRLYRYALFTIPCDYTGLLMLPNPVKRYCIDLTAPNVRWDRSRIMRKAKRQSFRLTVNADYGGSLQALITGHHEQGRGHWFTDELRATFESMAADPACPVKHCVFELWDEADGSLVAITAGFGVGRAFHDYSMCTLQRDDRSAGSLLSRAVAHLLKGCGYEIWYWG